MARYSKGAQKAVKGAVKRMEKGTLRSGKSDKKVTNPKQAIAIVLSEARKKGAKVPAKKTAVKKAAPKKAAKKAAPKTQKNKTAGRATATKKSAAGKTAIKKAAPKKTTVQKKPSAVKAAKKATPAKRPAPKKPTSRRQDETSRPPANDRHNQDVDTPANMVNTEDGRPETNLEPVEGMSPAPVVNEEDPLLAVDRKVMAKETAKFDRKHNMPVSSLNKSSVKPSGKKPLWNR